MKTNNKNVYILSLEGADLYSHDVRGLSIKYQYCGMLPNSKELDKLRYLGLGTKTIKSTGKEISTDVINVKFKQKVKSGKEILMLLNKKAACTDNADVKTKIQDFIETIDPEWPEVKNNTLREFLYENGFVLNGCKYVVYKRSSSKSRTGQTLFIKESLHDRMIRWSRMNLDFTNINYPALLAYESLVNSGIERNKKINPDNILIICDIEQTFKKTCNAVKAEDNESLDSYEEEVDIVSSLFDGQSLLQSNYFPKGKSMMLLRNHMFKSAAFACDIQQFLQDYYESQNLGNDYEQWKIPTMFNSEECPDYIFAKDVHMIVCPSSLKALKFSCVIGKDIDMWEHWKKIVKDEGCNFGIVKSEKPTKRGFDNYGNPLQQMSYQMLNSLPATKEDIEVLAAYEKEYIENLKNNDDVFIEHIEKTANDANSNDVWVEIYKVNRTVVNTPMFREFRAKQISDYVRYIKGGKIRLPGDYCYLIGNPMEMLYHAVGVDVLAPNYEPALEKNQIYTKLFDFNREYVCFRNPHTSPSNVLIAENIKVDSIERYFKNLSPNIVIVNAIDFPIQRILSGMDYDSDNIAVFNHSRLKELAAKCKSFKICVNGVKSDPAEYKINNKDRAEIDNKLSMSQFYIGRVVNAGQWAMSKYWDLASRGCDNTEEAKNYLKIVDVCTVLSEISIDMAKKLYKIDLKTEIKHIETKLTGRKPLFFKYVSQNENIKNKVEKHKCPMDYLQEVLTFENAKGRKNIEFKSLLVKCNAKKRDRKQTIKILNFVRELDDQIRHVEYLYENKNDDDSDKEKKTLIYDINKHYENLISKYKVKPDTMYALLVMAENSASEIRSRLLNILRKTQRETFLNAFKQMGNENCQESLQIKDLKSA